MLPRAAVQTKKKKNSLRKKKKKLLPERACTERGRPLKCSLKQKHHAKFCPKATTIGGKKEKKGGGPIENQIKKQQPESSFLGSVLREAGGSGVPPKKDVERTKRSPSHNVPRTGNGDKSMILPEKRTITPEGGIGKVKCPPATGERKNALGCTR